MPTRPALFAALALATASAPAPAQHAPVRAEVVRDDIERLDGAIDRADRRDTISEREARNLRERLASLRGQFRALSANGLTRGEVRRLEQRINYIRGRLRIERVDYDRHAG